MTRIDHRAIERELRPQFDNALNVAVQVEAEHRQTQKHWDKRELEVTATAASIRSAFSPISRAISAANDVQSGSTAPNADLFVVSTGAASDKRFYIRKWGDFHLRSEDGDVSFELHRLTTDDSTVEGTFGFKVRLQIESKKIDISESVDWGRDGDGAWSVIKALDKRLVALRGRVAGSAQGYYQVPTQKKIFPNN